MTKLTMQDMERLEQLASLAETGVTLKHEEFTYLMNAIRKLRACVDRKHWVGGVNADGEYEFTCLWCGHPEPDDEPDCQRRLALEIP